MQTHLQHARRAGESRTAQTRVSEQPRQADPLLDLQRTIGNHATTALIVQREFNDNADDFIKWMLAHDSYTTYRGGGEGECSTAAKALGEALTKQSIAHVYRGLLGFAPDTHRRELNRNHFVVVATIAGTRIVIDPTQSQFKDGSPQVASEADWTKQFKLVKVKVLNPGKDPEFVDFRFKYVDGKTFEDANTFAKNRLVRYDKAEGTDL